MGNHVVTVMSRKHSRFKLFYPVLVFLGLTTADALHKKSKQVRKFGDWEDQVYDVSEVENLPQSRDNLDSEHSDNLFSNRSTILVPSLKPKTHDERKKKDKSTKVSIFTTDPRRSFNLAACDREEKVAQRLGFIAHHYWKTKRDHAGEIFDNVAKIKISILLNKMVERVKRNLGRLHIIRNTKKQTLKKLLLCKNEEAIGILVNGGENVIADINPNFDFNKFYKNSGKTYDSVENDFEHVDKKSYHEWDVMKSAQFLSQFYRPAILPKSSSNNLFDEPDCPNAWDKF